VRASCRRVRRLNNDADADGSQDRGMEKIENLYRTATAEDLANTPEQIRSRLRDSG
jgi:hypothetical protein